MSSIVLRLVLHTVARDFNNQYGELMKQLLILSITLFSIQTYAGDIGFSQDLTGTYTLVKATGTNGHERDCAEKIELEVENNKLIIDGQHEKEYFNGCNEEGEYRLCRKSSPLSYEYFDHYVDDGMNMNATQSNKIALSPFNKNKLTVSGRDSLNFVLFKFASVKANCTYKRI